MTLREMVRGKQHQGFSTLIAESLVGQEILLQAIKKSKIVDKTLIKGGVLMYNITKNNRRASRDLDFDLIRYDIKNNESIDAFIMLLNKSVNQLKIDRIGNIEELNQEDYKGKRVFVRISDHSYSFTIKLDIGVHTLFAIEQDEMEFNIGLDGSKVVLKINPVEQVIAEKLYSLAKLGVVSTRFKDLYDVYYLLKNYRYNKKIIVKCLELLVGYGKNNIKDIYELIDIIVDVLNDDFWRKNFDTSNANWLEIQDNQLFPPLQ